MCADNVLVNPERLKQLAVALKKAAELVPDRKQKIANAINGWDGSWDGSKVASLAGFLQNEWKAMEDRADLATTYANQPQYRPNPDPNAGFERIPWEITPEMQAQEGMQDARDINAKLNSDDEAAREQGLSELAWAMRAHADDPAWLQAFMSYGGGAVVDRANGLTIEQDVPIDETGQDHLRYYAQGIAAATTMAENGDIQVPDDAFDPLLDQDSVLATGIMMKFGPKGDAYGSGFLTRAGQAALDWRKNATDVRPSYSEGMVTSGGYAPGGYTYDDDAWFTELGIDIDYIHTNAEDAAAGMALLREYDPSLAILDIVGDNPEASRGLLSGDKGADNAAQLVDHTWQSPPGMDDSAAVAEVITAATSDREGPEAKQSAIAAANLFQAGSDLYGEDRSDYAKEQYPDLPPTLAQALSQMGSAYVVDMAQSTVQTDPDVNTVVQDADGNWVVQTNTTVMNGFMGTFMTDPEAAGSFQGSVDALLTGAAQTTVQYPDEATNLLEQTGYLKGMTEIALSTQKFDEAAALDAQNKREQMYTDALAGIVSAVPKGDTISTIWGIANTIRGAAGDTLFPQDAADTYTSEAQFLINQGVNDMRIPVAQGFVNGGGVELPEDASFVHNGTISPRNEQEQAAFDNWYATLPDSVANLNDAPDGYQDATNVYAPNDDKFDDPK